MRTTRSTRWRVGLLVTALLGLPTIASVAGSTATAAPLNPTALENTKPGASNFKTADLVKFASTLPAEDDEVVSNETKLSPLADWVDPAPISGFTTKTSYNAGETIPLKISSKVGNVNINVYRQGWYGGTLATLVHTASNVTASAQVIPTPDPTTGLVQTNWTTTYTIPATTGWTSGVYLVRLDPAVQTNPVTPTQYIMFVVREDSRASNILMVVPTATYNAYNAWGGKSLYDYNSVGGRAYKVSADRPYDTNNGAGLFFAGDYQTIHFLEKNNHDVTYATSEDLDANPTLLTGHKMFLTNYHDEYYSAAMRDTIVNGRNAGTSLAYFTANSIYYQHRYETGSGPRRVMVAYKDAALDPLSATDPSKTTVLWRQYPVLNPENAVLGSMFENGMGYGQSVPWVVSDASSWIYTGTGLSNGQTIDQLVGYEFDRLFDDQGVTPAGINTVAYSPVVKPNIGNGINSVHHAVTFQVPNGAWTFNAGTNYWGFFLEGAGGITPGGTADARVQQMTANVIAKFTAPLVPPTTTTSTEYIGINPERVLDTRDGTGGTTGLVAPNQEVQIQLGGARATAKAVALNIAVANPAGSGWVTAWPCGSAKPNTSNINFNGGDVVSNFAIVKVGTSGRVCVSPSVATLIIVDLNGYYPSTSGFSGVNPERRLDSRNGTGTTAGIVPAGSEVQVQMTGIGNANLPADTKAVAAQFTVTGPAGAGWITVWPCGTTKPLASNLNFVAGQTIGNLVVAKVGTNGRICVSPSVDTHILADLQGAFTSSMSYVGTTPERMIDTRPNLVFANGVLGVRVTTFGTTQAPVSTQAVAVNLTVTEPTGAGWVTVWPCGTAKPLASNINFVAGQTIANLVLAKVGSGGRICVSPSTNAKILVDLNGYHPN